MHVFSDWSTAAWKPPRLSPARTMDGEKRLKQTCVGSPSLSHKSSKCCGHTNQQDPRQEGMLPVHLRRRRRSGRQQLQRSPRKNNNAASHVYILQVASDAERLEDLYWLSEMNAATTCFMAHHSLEESKHVSCISSLNKVFFLHYCILFPVMIEDMHAC